MTEWTVKGENIFPAPGYPTVNVKDGVLRVESHAGIMSKFERTDEHGGVFAKYDTPWGFDLVHFLEICQFIKEIVRGAMHEKISRAAYDYTNYWVPQWYLDKMGERAGRWALKVSAQWVRDSIAMIEPQWWEDQKLMWSTKRHVPTTSVVSVMEAMKHKDYRKFYGCRVAIEESVHRTLPEEIDDWIQWAFGTDVAEDKKMRRLICAQPGGTTHREMRHLWHVVPFLNFRPPATRQVYYLLQGIGYYKSYWDTEDDIVRIQLAAIQRSSRYNINKGLHIAGRQYGYTTLRKQAQVVTAVRYLMDTHPVDGDTVASWAERSVAAHAMGEYRPGRRYREYIPYETQIKAALSSEPETFWELKREPPKGFVYLGDTHLLANESKKMRHCVVTYIPACRNGHSFIFSNGVATVEVDRNGGVLQSHGLNNATNDETKAAAATMKRWLKKGDWLPDNLPPEPEMRYELPF